MKYLVISGAEPTRVSSLTFRISTTSSLTSRWPLLMSSRAASLFPMPLSPVMRTPSPNTSTRTPWMLMQGASLAFNQRVTSAITSEVGFAEDRQGTP